MEYLIHNESELDAALTKIDHDDQILVEGRVLLSKPLTLSGVQDLHFIGKDGAAFDMMREISGFASEVLHGVEVWTANIPSEIATLKPYAAFSRSGEMLHRPRLPKTGFYHVKGWREHDLMNAGMREDQESMIYGEGELPVMQYPEVAQIRAFHWWTDELCYIKSIDYTSHVIEFSNHPIFTMKCENSKTDGARWYMDNVFEALDSAGEYFITPDCTKIYYVPEKSDRLDSFSLFVSTTEKLMRVHDCDGVSFEKIEFKGSDRDKMQLVRRHSQAASDVPCAMDIDASAHISFTNCKFLDIGLSCVGIDNGSHDVAITGCEFTGIGGTPIYIKGVNLSHDDWHCTYPAGHYQNNLPAEIQHDISVENCHISDYGRVYYNACGIVLQYAYNCRLVNNLIHDGYYTGISVGWVWGYGPHATHHVLVENNHIYNIGKTLLSDMGGIYTLGNQEGTVIRGNRIHNIEMDSYGGWGVYLDEGSSDILVERNICYDMTAQPFHQHYGANNLLRHNIFAFGEGGAIRVSRKEDHLGIILERNILVSDGTAVYTNTPDSMHITDCMNLCWNYAGEVLSGPMDFDVYQRLYSFPKENQRTPEQMQEGGYFAAAIIADPKFVDVKNRDFRLQPDSPAIALGFEWDVKK